MQYNDIDFNNKTILITGGAGFIGSNLAFYLQENFPKSRIVIFDCFRSGEILSNNNLKSFGHYKNLINYSGDLICGDINIASDLALLNDYKFDFIFHLAAISDSQVEDQEIVMRTNVNSFHDILKIAKKSNASTVYASSAATYGNSPSPQILGLEKPNNVYGYSKYIMDQVAINFSAQNPDLSIVGLRFFNVYGSREFYKAKTSSMVIQFGHQILNGENPRLFINSNKIMRDFVNIKDVIQANIKSCTPKQSGVYNVGTGTPRSFVDIVEILQKELTTNLKPEFIPNPYKNYQMHTQADISSSIENLGFKPLVSLEQGIKEYMPEIKDLHGKSWK